MLNINAAYSFVQTSWKWNVSDKHLSKHTAVNVTSYHGIPVDIQGATQKFLDELF